MSIEPLSDIIMAIYESALAPDGWSRALRQLAEISNSGTCRIMIQSDLTSSLVYSVSDGIAAQKTEANGTTAPFHERELIPVGEPIVRSRMPSQLPSAERGEPLQFNEEKLADVLTVVLFDSGTDRIVLEAVKTDPQSRYTDRELERMRLVTPHICRAIRISDSLNVNRLTSEMFEASLEALTTGVYFIGHGDRVVYLNRAARAQVKSCKVLRLVDGRLAATDRAAQKLLQAELREIGCNLDIDDRPGATIALADGEGAGYVAHLLPLRGGSQTRIARHFAAIAAIFVQDPASAASPANAAFAKLYGLTDGELRLLNGLMPGLSLAETAQLLGIGEATAKTHLRRIFAKTRTAKQAELLYLLMTSTPPTIAR
jgi:DNA-binding CsgD family transcriptional regulator